MSKTDQDKGRPAWQPVFDPRLTLRREPIRVPAISDQDSDGFEIQFYESVLSEDPCNEDALMLLGHAYTQRGDLHKGLDVDRRLVRLRPGDPTAFYNLACSYALLDQVEDAFASLERAFRLGYCDVPHIMQDPDLETLRRDPRFREFIMRFVNHRTANS